MEEDKPSSPSSGVGLDRMEEFPPAGDVLEWKTEGEGMEVEVEGEILRDQDGAREKLGNERAQCVSDLKGIFIEREDPDKGSHSAHLRICGEGKQFQSSKLGKSGSHSRETSELPSLRTNEKQYKCSECGKGFYRIASLSLHKTFHVPYKCDECEKCFHHKSNLGLHEKVHQAMGSTDCGKKPRRTPDNSRPNQRM
uniref:zinc finger protein with KRAB and SCAN domains 1-like n=1 Tax=Podarcis muralis TaxID=64176 RepID=UPI00109F0BE7|nr:zinc finger protein with KRAB and SCAN domains 1-like [Podarcis muralis]